MVCYSSVEKCVLLSADHISPKITPNIPYWFHGDDNPLQSYLTSSKMMKQLDVTYVIPSHGKPFYGANDRIDELFKHTEERLEETIATIGPESHRLRSIQLTIPPRFDNPRNALCNRRNAEKNWRMARGILRYGNSHNPRSELWLYLVLIFS